MADVFTALVGAIANCIGQENCQKCEYRDIRTKTQCKTMLLRDALELLKAQEPVEAKTMGESKSHGAWWFACGACGHAIDPEDNFCRECGKAVKWK